MRPRTLIIARDPGAANAIIPVVRGGPATVIGLAHARSSFEQAGIQCVGPTDDEDPEVAGRCLDQYRPEVLLTGTSREELVLRDGQWWRAGHLRGIPTVALLDHWLGYRERFSALGLFDHLPDIIAVMDEYARQRMVELGCPAERLVVTGQPALDALLDGALPGRSAARRRWGVGDEDWVIVFASEPVAQDFGDRLGYNEQMVLRMVIEAIRGFPARLIVKLHPRETPDLLRQVIAQSVVPAQCEAHLMPRDTMAGADTVIGMASIFLLEAALAGKPVLSVQPGMVSEWTQHFSALIAMARSVEEVQHWCKIASNRAVLGQKARIERNAVTGFAGRAAECVWTLMAGMASSKGDFRSAIHLK